MEATDLLGPGAGWWYTSWAVLTSFVVVFLFISLAFVRRRKYVAVLGLFAVAHTLLFIPDGHPLFVSYFMLPVVVPLALRFQRSQFHAPGYIFLLLLIFGAIILSFAQPGVERLTAVKFLFWAALGIVYVYRLKFSAIDQQSRELFRWLSYAGVSVAMQLIASLAMGVLAHSSLGEILNGRNTGGYIFIPIGGSNTLASILVVAILCGWAARVSWATLSVQLLGLGFTLSRGAIFALFVATAFLVSKN